MLQTKDYVHFRVGDDNEFTGANLACMALPGDTVIFDYGQVTQIVERANHKHIVGTLELAAKVRYGMTSRNHPIVRFTPFSESYPPFFVGCSQKDVSRNVLAIIDFDKWENTTCPRGNLVEILGPAGEVAVEELALAIHASPVRWKRGEEELIEPAPLTAPSRRGITFHVDPAGCKDIDDAITLIPTSASETEVRIHIADVSSWLLANPGLTAKASQISQTLYRDGAALKPMFPPALSEDKFSLLPGQDRRAWTAMFVWNKEAKTVSAVRWEHETIRVSQSFTYYTVLKSMFASELEEICSGIAGKPVTDPHEWIEHLMIFYNREAAKLLRSAGTGVLRRHSAPDEARLAVYTAAGLPVERLAMAAGEYCEATAPDARHWGLGEEVYCHATSPIRRWSDCLNQLAIRAIVLGEGPIPTSGPDIQQLNRRAKAIKAYERDLFFMRAVLGGGSSVEAALVVESGRAWVAAWGRIVKVDTGDFTAGTPVRIKFFCDATQRNWKRRMVLALA
jgi:exoribonuclease R